MVSFTSVPECLPFNDKSGLPFLWVGGCIPQPNCCPSFLYLTDLWALPWTFSCWVFLCSLYVHLALSERLVASTPSSPVDFVLCWQVRRWRDNDSRSQDCFASLLEALCLGTFGVNSLQISFKCEDSWSLLILVLGVSNNSRTIRKVPHMVFYLFFNF